MYKTPWSKLPEDERKAGLVRNFEYRIDKYHYLEGESEDDVKSVFLSPNGDEMTLEEVWEWLEYNGVSLEKSYQENMDTYLSKHGFIREKRHGKTLVFNQYREQIIQKEALKFIDRKRNLPRDEHIEQQITTNISQSINNQDSRPKTKLQAIQDWSDERSHKQSFQDWLLEKAGYR